MQVWYKEFVFEICQSLSNSVTMKNVEIWCRFFMFDRPAYISVVTLTVNRSFSYNKYIHRFSMAPQNSSYAINDVTGHLSLTTSQPDLVTLLNVSACSTTRLECDFTFFSDHSEQVSLACNGTGHTPHCCCKESISNILCVCAVHGTSCITV